jgi:hypothetical protein
MCPLFYPEYGAASGFNPVFFSFCELNKESEIIPIFTPLPSGPYFHLTLKNLELQSPCILSSFP